MGFNVVVLGMAGVGKSSLVERLCRKNTTAISSFGEGTLQINEVENCIANWTVFDVPGYGTNSFKTHVESLSKIHNVQVDLFILCIGQRVYAADTFCFDGIKHRAPVVIARTRCDIFPCERNQLRYLHRVFPGSNVFGVSMEASSEYFTEFMEMVLYVEAAKNMRE